MSAAIPVLKNQQTWVDVDKNSIYPMMGSLERRFTSWEKNIQKITFVLSSVPYSILVKNSLV